MINMMWNRFAVPTERMMVQGTGDGYSSYEIVSDIGCRDGTRLYGHAFCPVPGNEI